MNLKIQICGKVTGENERDCKEKFEKAEKSLLEAGANTVINPMKIVNGMDVPWEEAMDICRMSIIEDANSIYLLNDWMHSRGAIAEHRLAYCCGKLIFKEEDLEKIREMSKVLWVNTSDIEFP